MNQHPCQHRAAPDAACRQPPPFQGHGAGVTNAKRADRLKDMSIPLPVGDCPATLGHEAMAGLWMREKQFRHLKSVGIKYRGVFKSAYSGRSLRACVNAFCLDCIGLDPDEIRRCTAPDCPLWAVRPYRRKEAR